jgi:hypothetical protein
MLRRLATAGAVAAAAIAIAACGSDDGSGGSGGGDFVAEADAICTEAARESVDAYASSLEEAGEEQATLAYIRGLQEARTREIETIEQLSSPAEQEETFDEYLRLRRASADRLGDALAAAEDEDRQGFETARAEAEAERDEADELGAQLGFAACANRLPEESEAAVTQVIETSATSDDAEEVCGLGTDRFVDRFGGFERCVQAQMDSPAAKSVEVSELRGADGVFASARIELLGRDDQIETFDVNLTFEGGEWKIETIGPAADKPR